MKKFEEMTKEEMKDEILKTQQKMQEEFMEKLLDSVEHLNEKSFKTSYIVSVKEKQDFTKIYNIINNMAKWF